MTTEWTPRPAADVGAENPARRPERARTRLPAAEVRRRMLAQGLQVVQDRGLTVGLDDIRLEDLISAADVPRSSVWRIWTTKQEYVSDLLVAAADPDAPGLFHSPLEPQTVEATGALLAAQAHRLGTPEGRRAALEDVLRVVVARHLELIAASRSWRTYNAILSTFPAVEGPQRSRLEASLYAAERDSFLEGTATFLGGALTAVGLRLRRPDYTWLHVATAMSALLEGLAVRTGLRAPDDARLPTLTTLVTGPLPAPGEPPAEPGGPGAEPDGPGAEPDGPGAEPGGSIATAEAEVPGEPGEPEWTLTSIAVMALVDAFCEDADAARP